MIIPGNNPKSPLVNKIQTDRDDETTSSVAPPPSYGSHLDSQPVSPVTPRAVANSAGVREEDPLLARSDSAGEGVSPKPKRWTTKRLGAVFFWGFILVCVLVLIITKFFTHSYPDYEPEWLQNSSFPSLPPGVKLTRCTEAEEWVSNHGGVIMSTFYQIPLTEDLFFLENLGEGQKGKLTVTTASILDDMVQVQVRYIATSGTQDIQFCQARKGKGRHGAVLVSPRRVSPGTIHSFEVDVVLPQVTRDVINAFALNLENYEVKVEDMSQLEFDQVSIWTTYNVLSIEGLLFRRAELRNLYGEITGYVSATQDLQVRSTKGDVSLSVQLVHNPNYDYGEALGPALQMLSNGGVLKTRMTLTGQSNSSHFAVDLGTSNARLEVDVASQPLDSTLLLTARTSNAPVVASLDSAYEGRVNMNSIDSQADQIHMEVDTKVSDPTGCGRKRAFDVDYMHPSSVRGYLYWGERRGKERGTVNLITIKKPITLKA